MAKRRHTFQSSQLDDRRQRKQKKGISSMFMSSGTELSPGTTIFRLTAFYTILSEVDNCNHGCISWFHSTKPQLALQLRHPDTLRAHVPLGQVCALTYLQKTRRPFRGSEAEKVCECESIWMNTWVHVSNLKTCRSVYYMTVMLLKECSAIM